MPNKEKVFIVGTGGQARVVYEILEAMDCYDIIGFTAHTGEKTGYNIFKKPVLGDYSCWSELKKDKIINSIVAVGDNTIREARYNQLKESGFKLINAVHPSAMISPSAVMGEGVTICLGAFIHTGASIGNNTVINTGAIVEHDCIVGDHVHVAPGSTILGAVTIGSKTLVGAGSVIKQCLSIHKEVIIGAGSVVLSDVSESETVAGTPARAIRKNV